MRVLFWGTPDFAAPAFRALIGEGFDVVGAVTQPDKPQGRNRDVTAPPVKAIALEERIPVFQPSTPKDADFVQTLLGMQPDISIVVAYGHILPRPIIDMPRFGTLNIHASLLPLLRGAAPIQAAIREGHSMSGVSIMRMVPALDAGPVILQANVPILDDETYGELQLRLSELGALTLMEALALMSLGESRETAQDDSLATYAPKVTREQARIDWSLSAIEVSRTVRAFDPKPGAFTTRDGTDVKMFGARLLPDSPSENETTAPGTAVSVTDGLVIACRDGLIRISDVQPSGKSRMTSAQWARGRGVTPGDIFGT
ncbi:MAG TPA: methionyl-tRNA formyltransferase [Gemmatimonadaceae bacterium]|nr:methionyl-tRNA formyltransferase [Gemmatimonadaceae bacterium]